jgi:hypothetical protein
MKKHLLLMTITAALTLAGCDKKGAEGELTPGINEIENVPPYAASNKVWIIGNQTWSDAIHIPECDNPGFEDSDTEPRCYSYTSDTTTRHYYNWVYVDTYASDLCPSPWRVPACEDFETLTHTVDHNTLGALWGYGGYANGGSMHGVGARAYYWSSTENTCYAYNLLYSGGNPHVNYDTKYYGFQVRCVK